MIKHTWVAETPASVPALFSLAATPQHQRGYCLLGTAKCSFCRLKWAHSPGQKDRSGERAA